MRRIKQFCLFDDDFMTKCFEGSTECTELVLRIIMDIEDLIVTDVRTQIFVENLLNRSVRLDVLAADSNGRKYNIEIQRQDKGAGRKRARYNSSMIDTNLLKKGEDFARLPETYVIFITENDVLGKEKPVYHINRFIEETGERFDDGSHILYVNGSYRDETPIGKLMHDFSCREPSDMNYEILRDRSRFFKESKEGNLIMSKIMEDLRSESF
ncbi:MAG: Rpn family recombination-promoting nuclease/putative transposase, partial [Firmicutes bacterium]|nr:Rpn family recombination-promoting nuclease/putative transposase [Bacillota bacterium]